jgi:hypothetical protein
MNHAASEELLALSLELDSIVLSPNSLDQRLWHRTNKLLSNKDFYSIAFRHLQIDELASKVWRSVAPLKCKIFWWLAKRHRLPTNERRFRHQLSASASCPSCALDEDVAHLLLSCHRAREVWQFFNLEPPDRGFDSFDDMLFISCGSFTDSTTYRRFFEHLEKTQHSRFQQ